MARVENHDAMFNPDKADRAMLVDHLRCDHAVDDRRVNDGVTTTGLVVTHLARHDKGAEAVAGAVVEAVEVHGPIPEGGIVVIRGGDFAPEVFQHLIGELARVAGHDRFVVVLLSVGTPGAIEVLEARAEIDEIKAKLGVG